MNDGGNGGVRVDPQRPPDPGPRGEGSHRAADGQQPTGIGTNTTAGETQWIVRGPGRSHLRSSAAFSSSFTVSTVRRTGHIAPVGSDTEGVTGSNPVAPTTPLLSRPFGDSVAPLMAGGSVVAGPAA